MKGEALALKDWTRDRAGNLPALPGTGGPTFGIPDMEPPPFVLPSFLLERRFFPGVNAGLPAMLFTGIRGPFP